MKSIIEKISPSIKHVLNGFERLVFKGHLLPLLNETNIPVWLSRRGDLIKDFKFWMSLRVSIIHPRRKALRQSNGNGGAKAFERTDLNGAVYAEVHPETNHAGAQVTRLTIPQFGLQTIRLSQTKEK